MDNDRPKQSKSVRWPEEQVPPGSSRPPVQRTQQGEDYFNYRGGSGNRPSTPRAGPSSLAAPVNPPIAEESSGESEAEFPSGDDGDEEFNYNYRPIDRISHQRANFFQLGNDGDRSSVHEEDDDATSPSETDDDDGDDDEERNLRAATRANTWFNRRTSGEEIPRVHVTPPSDRGGTTHQGFDQYVGPVHPMGSVLDLSGAAIGGGLAPGAVSRPDDGVDNDPHDEEYRQRRDALLSKIHARSQPSTPLIRPEGTSQMPQQEGDIPLMDLDRSGRQAPAHKPLSLHPPPPPKAAKLAQARPSEPERGRHMGSTHHHRDVSSSTADSTATNDSSEKPQPLATSKDDRTEKNRRGSNESHRSHTSQNSREGVPRFRLHETAEDEEERKRQEERVREEAEELARKLVKTHLRRARNQGNDAGYVDNPQLMMGDHDIEDSMRMDPDRPGEALEPSIDSQEENDNENEKESSNNKGENRGRFIRFLLGKGRKGDDNDGDDGSSTGDGNSMEKEKDHTGEKADDDESSEHHRHHHHDSGSDHEDEHNGGDDYIPPPQKVKEGVLGSLLRLYAGNDSDDTSIKTGKSDWTDSTAASPVPSRDVTPLGTPVETPFDTPRTSRSNSPSSRVPSETPPASTSSTSNTAQNSLASLAGAPRRSPSPYQHHNVAPMGVHPQDAAGMAAAAAANQKNSKHFLRRPQFARAASSEDVLGRENKHRPKWYQQHRSMGSTTSLGKLAASSLASVAVPHLHGHSREGTPETSAGGGGGGTTPPGPPDQGAPYAYGEDKNKRDRKDQRRLQKRLEKQKQLEAKRRKKERLAEQMRITVHIADVLQRQRFILRLGRALMLFGAPSHRLEEYLKMTARVLEIDCQLLYLPGCMLVSFGDAATHTSETKLIRVTQGLNLTKLHATHLIYKEVVHDIMDLEEASAHIDNLLRTKNIYPWWLVVIFYGLAGACLCMFSFGGRWPDFGMTFLLAAGVGFLQNYVQPRSDLYSNIFEVSSSIFVSFVGRALGSISYADKSRGFNGHVFCFAAMVEGALALILPGYIILCGSLELQSRNLVAGAVRMFYATIYSLFLSFGITLGSLIFGWCAPKTASRDVNCPGIGDKWKILFVPLSTMFMAMVNQASYRQLPVMVFVGSAGYTVLYFVQNHLAGSSPFTSAMGAFTMGILGNLYSRIGHGLAFAAMLPGVFVIVPSGVAAQGSLVAGVEVANAIVNESSRKNSVSINSETQAVSQLGNTMTQVAVGITVGLFAATLVVYPLGLGKKRSGLFTF